MNMISCFRILVIFFTYQVKNTEPHFECDVGNNTWSTEGIQGQVGRFPWLGVIRVHLHEGAKIRIAVTGAILVKDGYAIANADDVSRIPKRIFRRDSKAMFIIADDTPWSCKLKDFVAHPEYEYSTLNTIAIVELELEDNLIPLLPICWPGYMYNASDQLFALGYTDENQLLEKVAYRVQYVPKSICEEFYSRSGLLDHRQVPTHYECGFPENNTQNCEWDNGMVLAANASSTWVLIGLGIRGPGCSTPVRFIEVFQYLPWIEQITDNQVPDYSLRKANRPEVEQKIQDIPVHQFFRAGNDQGTEDQGNKDQGNKDQGTDKGSGQSGATEPPPTGRDWDLYDKEHSELYDITRIDESAIVLSTFKNKYEETEGDCLSARSRYLVYRESMTVIADPDLRGVGSYKLALIDMAVMNYTCILIQVVSLSNSGTSLYYATEMEVDEPLDVPDKTPDFLMKKYPTITEIPPRNLTTNDTKWEPPNHSEPHFVTDIPRWWKGLRNINLFLTFHFIREAELKLEVWGKEAPLPSTSTTIPTTRTRTKPHRRKLISKAQAHELKSDEVATIVETDRNFKVKNIESGSERTKSFGAMVILFAIFSVDK